MTYWVNTRWETKNFLETACFLFVFRTLKFLFFPTFFLLKHYAYGLKSLICHLADLRKKSRICRKRKARTSWDIHTLTRNAHQLYNIVSIISAKKIHFARPKDDFTFTQTSRSLKLFNPLCQLSLADLSQTITAFSTYYGLMKAVVYVVVEEERLWFRSLFTRETNGENALTSVFVAEI